MDNIDIIGKNCCGCRACEQSCNVHAISFFEDAEGFMYPSVDEKLCVGCGRCVKVCPVNTVTVFHKEQEGFAAKSKNPEVLKNSSSGGLFFSMARAILEAGGVVCGCSTDNQLMPRHIIATTIKDAEGMRGSKYVQSNMAGVYTQVQSYLKKGVKVLFTGVPCQIAGLRSYLGAHYPNLYCVDIICHGVPSRKLYASYLRWLEEKWGGKVARVDFRSKKKHQWSLTLGVTIQKKNGRKKEHLLMGSLDPYYYNFLLGNTYRESCYTCAYSQNKRPGDITIGDFWGIEYTYPNLYDLNGISCALINSEQGKDLWKMIADTVESYAVNPSDIINYNGNLRAPSKRPPVRDSIYKVVNENGFRAVPYDMSFGTKLVDSIKNSIPNKYRYAIKTVLKKK